MTPTAAPARETRMTVADERNAVLSNVRKMVEDRRAQLGGLLGKSVDLDRFITVALSAIQFNPELLDADPVSILGAIRDSATYGLEPVGALGEGAIVPYRKDGRKLAQFQPMYRGLMKLARRSGEVQSMDAQVVYENDQFDVDLGTEPRILHRPAIEDRGNHRLVYAYARLRSGELVVEILNMADVARVRAASKSYSFAKSKGSEDTIWLQWPEEMMKKSALKRLMKKLPLEAKAAQLLALDNDVETQEPARPVRQSAAVTAIHQKLGMGSTRAHGDEEEPVARVVNGEEAAEREPVTDGTPEAICESVAPYEGGARCGKAALHSGLHSAGSKESWA